MSGGAAQARKHRRDNGKESPFERRMRESEENARMVERCARCPEWMFEGTAIDCLAAGALHRADVHPETVGWKRPRKQKKIQQPKQERIPAAIVAPVAAPRRGGPRPAPAPQSSWRSTTDRLTPARLAAAAELYREGLTLRGICDVAAERWEFTPSALRFHLAVRLPAAGVEMRPRGGRKRPVTVPEARVVAALERADSARAA